MQHTRQGQHVDELGSAHVCDRMLRICGGLFRLPTSTAAMQLKMSTTTLFGGHFKCENQDQRLCQPGHDKSVKTGGTQQCRLRSCRPGRPRGHCAAIKVDTGMGGKCFWPPAESCKLNSDWQPQQTQGRQSHIISSLLTR